MLYLPKKKSFERWFELFFSNNRQILSEYMLKYLVAFSWLLQLWTEPTLSQEAFVRWSLKTLEKAKGPNFATSLLGVRHSPSPHSRDYCPRQRCFTATDQRKRTHLASLESTRIYLPQLVSCTAESIPWRYQGIDNIQFSIYKSVLFLSVSSPVCLVPEWSSIFIIFDAWRKPPW